MTVYKSLKEEDRVSTKTLLHEAIPITGTIVSGTYGIKNIQNYSHGMFQSVYDYPFLSSSANHIFDISFGFHSASALYAAATNQKAKKNNIYNQMAQVLMGYNKDGEIQRFDADGDISAGGAKIEEAIFIPFSRLLSKDEIKKGSFSMTIGTSASYTQDTDVFDQLVTIADVGAINSYRINSPAGEYGILYATGAFGVLDHASPHKTTAPGSTNPYWPAGLIYYQAGIVVLTSSVFMGSSDEGFLLSGSCQFFDATTTLTGSLISEQISGSADGLRNRIQNIQFNNTIELNSTVYFCRIKHNEFNYSSNPTYLSGSQIRVKSQIDDPPISYITSLGLYSSDNQLLAVGKFSEPIRKDSNIELTCRARVDY